MSLHPTVVIVPGWRNSGHGEWPLGLALLQSLMAEHAWSAQPQTELESA